MTTSKKLPPHQTILERFPDHAKAIGIISVEMANLDIFLGEMLGGILRVAPKVGSTIYLTPHSAFGRIEILERVANLVMVKDSHGLKHINSLAGRARTLINKRHSLIHDAWGMRAETGQVHRMKLPDLSSRPDPVDLATLNRIVGDIRVLGDDVREATVELYEAARAQQRDKVAAQNQPRQGKRKASPRPRSRKTRSPP
jgi:hypothetical protein